jgi:hypothetical protein
MKKFHVKDEEGEVFEVEELDADVSATNSAPESNSEVNDENSLSDDEISALKSLAAIAPKLTKLVENTADACDDEDEEELDNECEDPTVDDKDEQIEEVIDTDEETKPRDSKKSFGAIERKKKSHDSIDNSLDVESAWAKRYGGSK